MYAPALCSETFSSSLPQGLPNFGSEHDIETAQEVTREKVLQEMQQAPFYTLFIELTENNKIIRKMKPIALQIYRGGEKFFVENENLALFGEGSTTQQAVNDFVTHLKYFSSYYRSLDKSKLMGEGIRLKSIYDTIFQEASGDD